MSSFLKEQSNKMAKRRITQETFDDAVRENMEEFEMDPDEALRDAVEQFESQGKMSLKLQQRPYRNTTLLK